MSEENHPKQNHPSPEAAIVLDSGFNYEAVARVKNLLGYRNLNRPFDREQSFVPEDLVDPYKHGSVVLEHLLDADPNLPVVLVRCFDDNGASIKSAFDKDGTLIRDGWTEGYLWAQALCNKLGYSSVANCSFGGLHHAMDGSGWESFQLGRVVGPGHPGHLVVAAAGPGDGRALHASIDIDRSMKQTVHALQDGTSTYNLWLDRLSPANWASGQFILTARLNGVQIYRHDGLLSPNIWNGKQQLTFELNGSGWLDLDLQIRGQTNCGHFDIFVSRNDGRTHFTDWVDAELVSEPAVFSHVIAVGLKSGRYGQHLARAVTKPDVLLSGPGPISFRTPEVTTALLRQLAADSSMDSEAARQFCQTQVW